MFLYLKFYVMKKVRMRVFRSIVITAIMLLVGFSAEAKTVKFAQLTDIHYTVSGTTESGRDVSKSQIALQAAIIRLNASDVDFVVFLGDNIDKSTTENLEGFMNIVKDLKKPYYMIIGNHDAHKASGMSKEDYIKIIKKYNPNQFSKNSYFYFHPTPEIVAIFMDGTANTVPTAHGNFNKTKLAWLEKLLKKNKNGKAVILQHYPLIEPSDNPSHNVLNKATYLELLKNHDNVASISSGHYHAEQIKIDEQGITHISTPSLMNPPFEYHVVSISYDKPFFGKIKNFNLKVEKQQCL